MSNIVTCDVCGKIFNQSHLGAHKRLAHGRRPQGSVASAEPETMNTILSAYEKLSAEDQEELLERLEARSKRKNPPRS